MPWLAWFVLLALMCNAAMAILEEQAGEFDWKIDGIGEVQLSLSKVRLDLFRAIVFLLLNLCQILVSVSTFLMMTMTIQ